MATASTILGIPCELATPSVRDAVGEVLLKIRGSYPEDFRWLQRLLAKISPHPNPMPGDLGECVYVNIGATMEELRASDDPHFEERRAVYLVECELSPATQKGIIAHELGHVLSSNRMIDQVRADLVDDGEWASEAVADLYALRWGYESELRIIQDSRDRWHHRVSIDDLRSFAGNLDHCHEDD